MLPITISGMPDEAEIAASDLRFSFGTLFDSELMDVKKLPPVSPPSNAFLSFDLHERKFILGHQGLSGARITESGITFEAAGNPKMLRTLQTINRDFLFLNKRACFAFNTGDAQTHNYQDFFGCNKKVPVIQYHRFDGTDAIIMPLPRYHEYPSSNIPEINYRDFLKQKIPKIFWRGDLSGFALTPMGRRNPAQILGSGRLSRDKKMEILQLYFRYRVVTHLHSEIFADVGFVFSKYLQENIGDQEFLKAYEAERTSPQEQAGYRYLLALDGYDGPSSWYWMMSSGSVVLREKSKWKMFGDNYFIPWIHFIPVDNTVEDILRKIDWCERNLDECQIMVRNARAAWEVLFDRQRQKARRQRIYDHLAARLL